VGARLPSAVGFQIRRPSADSNHPIGWTYWALNGEDKFGLLDKQYDPTHVSPLKQSLLQSIQFFTDREHAGAIALSSG
jgi:hypothetical protein